MSEKKKQKKPTKRELVKFMLPLMLNSLVGVGMYTGINRYTQYRERQWLERQQAGFDLISQLQQQNNNNLLQEQGQLLAGSDAHNQYPFQGNFYTLGTLGP